MKPAQADHFKHYEFPRALKSGGGALASFETLRADFENNNYFRTLWLIREGVPTPLVQDGDTGVLKGHWWMDGGTLLLAWGAGKAAEGAWLSGGHPYTRLQVAPVSAESGVWRWRQTALFMDVEDAAALPDGRLLLVCAWDEAVEAALKAGGENAAAMLNEAGAVYAVTKLPFWENGGGYTGGRVSRLYLWQPPAEGEDPGGTLTPLTSRQVSVSGLRLSADKSRAYFIAQDCPEASPAPVANRLIAMDTDACEPKELRVWPDAFRYDGCVPLVGDDVLIYGSDMRRHGLNENPWFYMVNGKTGDSRPINTDGTYSGWVSVATDLSRSAEAVWCMDAAKSGVYFPASAGGKVHLARLDLRNGRVTMVTKNAGMVAEFALTGTGRLYAAGLREMAGPEVFEILPQPSGSTVSEAPVTHLNDAAKQVAGFIRPIKLQFKNTAGDTVTGWVLRPAAPPAPAPGGKEGKLYPAILQIHGGPKMAYGAVAFHEMQYLAGLGYAVIFCNPTGSDGYGGEFGDVRGKMGARDYEDIMAFVDEVLAQNPWIDPQRLGVTGGSYGGFMTNWIIGHTNRFRAAVSQRGISNWTTMLLMSDIGYFFATDHTGAASFEDTETLWRQSPLAYAQNVSTPTAFIHSQQDYRCPVAESIQMYTALKLRGVPTKMCLFEEENHELSRSGKPKNRLRRLEEIAGWFGKYL